MHNKVIDKKSEYRNSYRLTFSRIKELDNESLVLDDIHIYRWMDK